MGLTINTNMASLNAQNNLQKLQSTLPKTMAKLASGLQINTAADNAAGLAIATQMTSDVNAYATSIRNVNDGISMAQTAEGAMDEIGNGLQRVRELAMQAKSGQYSPEDVKYMQQEADAVLSEIDRTASQTTFNGQKLLDGSFSKNIAVGTSPEDKGINVSVDSMKVDKLGIDANNSLANVMSSQAGQQGTGSASLTTNPDQAIKIVDAAMSQVSGAKSKLGAVSNRFDSALKNLDISSESTQASRSRIMDTDYAQATADLTKNMILSNATTSTLAQANVQPQNALRLLQ